MRARVGRAGVDGALRGGPGDDDRGDAAAQLQLPAPPEAALRCGRRVHTHALFLPVPPPLGPPGGPDDPHPRRSGFERTTEGDSFTALFHSVTDALSFASSLQRAFLELRWPPALYDLRAARRGAEYDSPAGVVYRNQELIYRGLRVRMGIHFGVAGEAERVAKDVCDVTVSGGQVVATEAAWTEATSSQFPFEKKQRRAGLLERCAGGGADGGEGGAPGRKDRSYRSYGLQNYRSIWTRSTTGAGGAAATGNDPGHAMSRKESAPLQVDAARSQRQALYIECLGSVHIKNGGGPLRLISVLPEALRARARTFEPLHALQLSPGFAEAPNALAEAPEDYRPTCIVFIYVSGVETMLLTDEREIARRTMAQLEVEAVDACAREFGGYKCEAFDTGFLLAFADPRGAVAFSILVHKAAVRPSRSHTRPFPARPAAARTARGT